MTFTVRYTWAEPYLRLSSGEPFRPYVPIRLQNGLRHFDTLGLIDSGADNAMFNRQLAQALNLDLALGEQGTARGVGGEIPIVYFDIHLSAYDE